MKEVYLTSNFNLDMNRGFLLGIFSVLIAFAFNAQVACSFDNNQGEAVSGNLLWQEGSSLFIVADPTLDNSPNNPGCSSSPEFLLTSIEIPIVDAGWFNNSNPSNGSGTFQIAVWGMADQSDPCLGLGDLIWESDVVSRTVQNTPDSTEYFFPTGDILIEGKFFISYTLLSWNGSFNQTMTPVVDGLPRENCRQFISTDGINIFAQEAIGSAFGWYDVRVNGFFEVEEFANLQFIHASGDAAASSVDIRVDGEFPHPSFDNLDFKCATTTAIISAGAHEITINPANSTDASNPIATFNETFSDEQRTIGVINGIASSSGYDPGNAVAPLSIDFIDPVQIASAQSGETDIVVFNAVTDIDEIDVQIQGGSVIASNVAYGNASTYEGIETENVSIVVNEPGVGEIQDYIMPLSDLVLENAAVTLVALGFNDPTSNSNGEPFGIWLSKTSGGCMEELSFINSTEELNALKNLKVFPNPASDRIFIENIPGFDNGVISVLNGLGQEVIALNYKANLGILDIHDLEKGFYTILLKKVNGEPSHITKLIIN